MAKLELPVTVTPSRVELGLRCYRRHVLADVLGYAGYYSPSLEFGSVIHAGVATWWRNADIDGREARQHAAIATRQEWAKRFEANPQVSQKDVSLDLALSMVETYTKSAEMNGPFSLEPGDWQFVTIEDRLEVPLGKYRLSFQQDRVVYNKTNGHLVIVDTKTAGRMDARWRRQWETSLQMKLYKAAAIRAYDFEFDQVDVLVEGILKDVPSKIEYVPCPEWSPAILAEAMAQAEHIAALDDRLIAFEENPVDKYLIEEAAVTKTTVNYNDCFQYGVECPFRRLCIAEPEERVGLLRSEYFEIESEY